MSEQPTSDPFLGSYLYDLLITCLPSFSTLDEKQRKKRLRVCLKCLWSCVRAYLLPENSGNPYLLMSAPTLQVLTLLVGFGPKRTQLPACSDAALGRDSITPEMACISNIHGDPVSDWFLRAGSVDLANIVFLLSGELETLVDSGTKGYVEDIFQQTLSILAEGFVRDYDIVVRDREQEARFHERHSRFANARISDALKKTLQDISDRLHQLPPMRAEISSLEPHSGTTPPGMSQTSRGGPDAPESSSVVGISSTPAPVDEIV
ncbi:hypothetical protein EI94DRAFT_1798046 [Lactarius quietus]|nr:hypothetical protein EI94DRAFT_1798046 [Lactarius quietus]